MALLTVVPCVFRERGQRNSGYYAAVLGRAADFSDRDIAQALKINVSIIDLTAPGISFKVTPRAANYPGPTINGSPGETVRQTTRQYADAVGPK